MAAAIPPNEREGEKGREDVRIEAIEVPVLIGGEAFLERESDQEVLLQAKGNASGAVGEAK